MRQNKFRNFVNSRVGLESAQLAKSQAARNVQELSLLIYLFVGNAQLEGKLITIARLVDGSKMRN